MFKELIHIVKREKGFTLIELLVVIAIIGILASIMLPNLNLARRKARDGRRIAEVRQIQLALEFYFDSNKAYPVADSACDASINRGLEVLAPTLIPVVPRDPLNTGSPYLCYWYATTPATDPTDYHIGASLELEDNAVLDADRDFNSTSPAWPQGSVFDGSIESGIFIYYDQATQ